MTKIRTITLTARAPVRIHEDKWPIIAQANNYAGETEHQATGLWAIFVRAHNDGRRIVYGYHKRGPLGDYADERRAGYLLDSTAASTAASAAIGTETRTVHAIYAVAQAVGHLDIAAAVIADLPAEVL